MTTPNTPTVAELLKEWKEIQQRDVADMPTSYKLYILQRRSAEALQEAVAVLQNARQIQWHGEMKDGKPVLQNIADPNCQELLAKWGFK